MSDTSDPTVSDWARAARENVRDARRLAAGRGWRNAYMLSGIALECALKSHIMRHLGLNQWPARKERPEIYSHDLGKLAEIAGVRSDLEEAAAQCEHLGAAWMVAKDFAINRRYPSGRPFPVRLGRDMVDAVAGPNGLVEWLIRLPRLTR